MWQTESFSFRNKISFYPFVIVTFCAMAYDA